MRSDCVPKFSKIETMKSNSETGPRGVPGAFRRRRNREVARSRGREVALYGITLDLARIDRQARFQSAVHDLGIISLFFSPIALSLSSFLSRMTRVMTFVGHLRLESRHPSVCVGRYQLPAILADLQPAEGGARQIFQSALLRCIEITIEISMLHQG